MTITEVTSYQCLEALRRAAERGPQTQRQELWSMLVGNVLSFLGVRR
jgi:hypothetical protein